LQEKGLSQVYDLLPPEGRNRSKPQSGHLMRAMPWLQSPQRRKAEAARTMRGRRSLPKEAAKRCS